ncbi:unnamed protein product (macronuclear) [Paramecium tetraurelia]|uniref:Trichohyalin-plectin-homology domain-containing protein n=1 Tax=Paramecium tetraurelia TaxID=5888 RepID=A0BMZ8_PARTE|nr:uncharacterized protein GSPATT00030552001 [Paramecium tetraurelia]CAK59915.1 unnamed protein product [Paramecium tetraurelia]|eukprot:XP_001427313.1 hypothetical protein (macronuclear) [Paramecium tetraurelia strain d4-2]
MTEDIVNLFVSKYGSSDANKNSLLQKSIQKVLHKEGANSQVVTKLRQKLGQSQSQQQFFPTLGNGESSLPNKTPNDSQRKTFEPFTNRVQPFQRTYLQQLDQVSETSEKPPKSVYYVDRQDEDEWAALMKFDAQLYQKEQERKKELLQQKKAQMKKELDMQLRIKQERKQKEKDLEEKYNKFQSDLLQKKNEQELDKQTSAKNKLFLLQSERDVQLNNKKKKQHSEDRELRNYKKEISRRYQDELQKQIDEENRIKLMKREYMFKVMKQSETDKMVIMQKQRDQEKLEQENCEKYGELLDQIEQRRIEENRKKKEKVDKNNAWSESQLLKYKLEKEDDDKLQYWKQLEEQKFLEEEQRKKNRVNELKQKTIQSLEQSIKLKQKKKQQEKELDNLQGLIWKVDTDRFFQEEQDKLDQIKKVKIEHKKILQRQMQDKNKHERGEKMSIPELLQNKTILKTIKQQDIYDLEKTVV